ncbi:murein hydrolase activator NlpD [Candidatus Curculioniphilus buchneri]|uniref:murein hydrolase activator NlpD n=1 Tax=Candidatus Curculioniphilus buchneri TaxID=690594 RepID=UPI00376F01D9
MVGLKYFRHHVTIICGIASLCLGCIHNTSSSVSISNVDNYIPKTIQTHDKIKLKTGNIKNKIIVLPTNNTINNRHYDKIRKGYYSSATYQVKPGDTLFYIAWITGNDYKHLAKKNQIVQPYRLNVGQTLQVLNNPTLMTNKAIMKRSKLSNTNKTNFESATVIVSSIQKKCNQSNISLNNKNNHCPNSITKQYIKNTLPLKRKKAVKTAPMVISNTNIINWNWPTTGKIIDQFSMAEGGNKGIDISGSRGQPILATTHGRVVYAGNALRGYGNLIIIKHSNDYLSAYAHNHKILVREQQKVKSGQKIATMGNSGSNSIRLHFEIRHKGQSVNPLSYLPRQ